ncbi:MAG: TonB family protein [Chthoniobacterales bacterium]|nr:TonB family protein [Chthoniobacterales bacterium]
MKNARLIVVAVLVLASASASGAPTQPVSPSPRGGPSKTGHGLFLLDIDYPTGRITDVHILKSTGNPKLDATTIAKLRHWSCKPRTYTHVKIPITYTFKDEE